MNNLFDTLVIFPLAATIRLAKRKKQKETETSVNRFRINSRNYFERKLSQLIPRALKSYFRHSI